MSAVDSAATTPKPNGAATLVVLRPAAPTGIEATENGIEVFCVRRHGRSAFLGGVVAFPGGKLDPDPATPQREHHAARSTMSFAISANGVDDAIG